MGQPTGRALEVHQHAYITGPWANRVSSSFEHSHASGQAPHRHADTGPALFTIDKDEWFRATGLKGGGRKEYTDQPFGAQLPTITDTPPAPATGGATLTESSRLEVAPSGAAVLGNPTVRRAPEDGQQSVCPRPKAPASHTQNAAADTAAP
jgi:hypothetical protein